jgi:hypothetical protein
MHRQHAGTVQLTAQDSGDLSPCEQLGMACAESEWRFLSSGLLQACLSRFPSDAPAAVELLVIWLPLVPCFPDWGRPATV